jgi:threonine dehydrogenase-like Zn-dependent dehydrogenase
LHKGLAIRTGQTHVNRRIDDLLERILSGPIDPSFVITHRVALENGPDMYKTFREKRTGASRS